MLYADWHFCQNLQMTPREARDYLNTLFVLRQNCVPLNQRMQVLERLEQSDPLWQAYAIPDLVDILFSEESRKALNEDADEDLSGRFRDGAKSVLHQMIQENEKDAQRKKVFNDLVTRLDSMDKNRVIEKLLSVEDKTPNPVRNWAYLETPEYTVDLVALELLNLLSENEAEKVQKIVDENLKNLFLSARMGHSGLLPRKIALEIDLWCGRDIRDIEADFPKDWLSYPEFMEIFARGHLCGNEDETQFEVIRAELGTLALFQRYNLRGLSKDASLWFSDERRNKPVQCAVLWQSVLWELAWEANPEQCLQFANGIWTPPNYIAHGRSVLPPKANLNWIMQQLFNAVPAVYLRINKDDPERPVRQAVLTAWQFCAESNASSGTEEKHFQNAPEMRKTCNAIHAFAAAALLRRIFTECPDVCYDGEKKTLRNHSLLRLILNLGFVLESSGPREERLPSLPSYTWSQALRSLSCYAWRCITELGVGSVCRELPRYLSMDIRRGLERKLNNKQLIAVYGYQGLLVCARWIVRSQSLYTVSRDGVSGSPWEDKVDGMTCAETVCKILFDNIEGRQMLRRNSEALQLLSRSEEYAFPNANTFYAAESQFWYQRCLSGLREGETVTTYDVLCAPVPPPELWPELSPVLSALKRQPRFRPAGEDGDDSEWKISASAWELILTLRLCGVLEIADRQPNIDLKGWFTEWFDALSGTISLRDNPVLFTALMRLVRCKPRIPGNLDLDENTLDQILSLIIQIVDVFTEGEKAYFQYQLGCALADANPAKKSKPVDAANDADDAGERTDAKAGYKPEHLYRACAEHLTALCRQEAQYPYVTDILYDFLLRILSWPEENASSDKLGILKYMRQYYNRLCANSRKNDYHIQTVTEREWDPLRDRFLQRQDASFLTARQRVDFNRTSNGFASGSEREGQKRAIGIIASKKSLRPTRGRDAAQHQRMQQEWEYRVRTGGQTVKVAFPANFSVGDLVVLDNSTTRPKLFTPIWQRQDESETLCVQVESIDINGVVLKDYKAKTPMRDYLGDAVWHEVENRNATSGRREENFERRKREAQRIKSERFSEALDFWTPNTLSYEEGGRYRMEQGVNYCEVVYNQDLMTYLPVERNLFRLLLDKFYGKRHQTIRLFYISCDSENGVRYPLFSASPGFNYRLSEREWTEESFEQLATNLLQDDNAYGVSVNVRLTERNGFPLLELTENPFDFRNRDWAKLFDENEAFYAESDGTTRNFKPVFRVSRPFPPSSGEDDTPAEERIAVEITSTRESGRAFSPKANIKQNCDLAVNGWNRLQQRKRIVRAEPHRNFRFKEEYASNPEIIGKLLHLKTGDVVQTERYMKNFETENGYVRVLMNGTYIPMLCAVESITPLTIEKNQSPNVASLLDNRSCIVENVSPPDGKEDLSALETAKPIPAERIPEKLRNLTQEFQEARGIVVDMPESSKGGAGVENLNYKVSVLVGQEVVPVDLRGGDFGCPPSILGSKVVFRRDGDIWRASAFQQKVSLRALWKVEFHNESDAVLTDASLGVTTVGRDPRSYYVTQDSLRPTLHAWPAQFAPQESSELSGLRIGTVSLKRDRFCDWNLFKYAKHTAVAYLQGKDRRRRWGEVWKMNFSSASNGKASGTASIRIYEVDGLRERYEAEKAGENTDGKEEAARMPLYDVRVVFEPRRQEELSQQKRQQKNQDDLDWYKEWYAGEERHLIGKWTSQLSAAKQRTGQSRKDTAQFQLTEHQLPPTVTPDVTVQWLDKIPFLEGGGNQLWGAHVFPSDSLSRARMVERDGHWEASCLTAEPFVLGEDLAAEFKSRPEELIDLQGLYVSFAGPVQDEHTGEESLRFEWGYGYTFLAPRDRIVDMDYHNSDATLFYGDRIRKFCISKNKQDGFWYLCLPEDAIERNIVYHLWKDAGNGVVQMMRVWVDVPNNRVHTLRVSRVEYAVGYSDSLKNAWYFDQFSVGQISPESKARLIEEVKSENPEQTTAERLIFALLLVDEKTNRERPPQFRYLSLKNRDDVLLLAKKIVCLVAGDVEIINRGGNQKQSNDFRLKFYLDTELPSGDAVNTEAEGTEGAEDSAVSFVVKVNRRKFSLDESKLRVIYSRAQENPNALQEYRSNKMLVRLEDTSSLRERDSGQWEWTGFVRGICLRAQSSLKEWVRSRHDCLVTLGIPPRDRYGASSPDKLLVEVAPGITSEIETKDVIGHWQHGATALLDMEDDTLKARVILPGDEEYIPKNGRVMELLIMDGAANSFMQTPATPAAQNNQSQFTVAGFPQLVFRNPELLKQLIFRSWPRLALVRQDLLSEELKEKHTTALIECRNPLENPRLRFIDAVSEEDRNLEKPWSQLSFMDATAGKIFQSLKDGAWHYHDRTYGIYDRQQNRLCVRQLPSGRDYRKFLVFPDKNGSLRFPDNQFKQNGFPIRELMENGIPGERHTHVYAIAGRGGRAIWLEAFPGRLMEIPCQFLFVSGCRVNLKQFPAWILSPGDTVTLEEGASFKGGVRTLNVAEFHYGLRGALPMRPSGGAQTPAVNAVLPVRQVLKDGVLLGSSLWDMYYPLPAVEAALYRENDAATLNQHNQLKPGGKLSGGDVGLLQPDERGELRLFSRPDLKVYPSRKEEDWDDALWMKDLLENPRTRRSLFDALGTGAMLPVKCWIVEKNGLAWISKWQKEQFAEDAIVYGVILGQLTDKESLSVIGASEPLVLIQAGKCLLRVPRSQFLPDLRPEQYQSVLNVLYRRGIWLHRKDGGWYGGTHDAPPSERRNQENILLIDKVPSAHGFLCSSLQNRELLWLSYENACLTGGKLGANANSPETVGAEIDSRVYSPERDVDRIWEAFQISAGYADSAEGRETTSAKAREARKEPYRRGDFPRTYEEETGRKSSAEPLIRKALILPNRSVSLLNVNMKKQDSELLSVGTRCRVMPLIALERNPGMPMYRFIAEVYPQGELILLFTENRNEVELGKPRGAEVTRRSRNQVRAVLEGMRRERQSLTREMHKAYFRSHDSNGRYNRDAQDVQKTLPGLDLWEAYRQCAKRAADDVESRIPVRDIRQRCNDLKANYGTNPSLEFAAPMVYLYSFLSSFGSPLSYLYLGKNPDVAQRDGNYYERAWWNMVRGYLRYWLQTQGARLLQLNADKGNDLSADRGASIDVLSPLTAVLLLHQIWSMGETDSFDEDLCANAGKLSVHMLRMLGLLAEMSVQQEVLLRYWFTQERDTGLWRRLNGISIGGERTSATEAFGEEAEVPTVGKERALAEEGFNGTLSSTQLHRLVTQCEHILHLDMDTLQPNSPDIRKRISVAQSLLYSVRRLNNLDAYEETLEWLSEKDAKLISWELAKLGRTLTPKSGEEIAGDCLPDSTVDTLRKLWRECIHSSMPCLLLNVPVPLKPMDMLSSRFQAFCQKLSN